MVVFKLSKKHTLESFIEKYKNSINKNVEIIGEYVSLTTPIKCRCKICGNLWNPKPEHIKRGHGCHKCSDLQRIKSKTKTQKNFEEDIHQKCKHIKAIGKYCGSFSKTLFECELCGTIWNSSPSNVLYNKTGCPKCNSSIGERNISEFLDAHNIKYERQKTFDDCVLKERLRFDFYIEIINCVIEFQGEQHYYPVNFKGKNHEEEIISNFNYCVLRDNIKRKYCSENNIKMIEIPYFDKYNIEKYLNDII